MGSYQSNCREFNSQENMSEEERYCYELDEYMNTLSPKLQLCQSQPRNKHERRVCSISNMAKDIFAL